MLVAAQGNINIFKNINIFPELIIVHPISTGELAVCKQHFLGGSFVL